MSLLVKRIGVKILYAVIETSAMMLTSYISGRLVKKTSKQTKSRKK